MGKRNENEPTCYPKHKMMTDLHCVWSGTSGHVCAQLSSGFMGSLQFTVVVALL